ncbi:MULTISPECIES: DUF1292 domain-containing protein [Clostridium]|uniref:UPF0473 protein I6U51_14760 n=1 Tax=Clostridium aciditolerans TaxID=339861 RepID=A0A934M4E8_9CLOT|nr:MULTISPECIES: DUF1292 domain-containing protein [Clostridium]MBI6873945.1 DUF1292 domain-containing protein [Clostridium aciditolerans]WML35183.1 DUF1292 domain-containing protein [Clostridium sp. OS1-26]
MENDVTSIVLNDEDGNEIEFEVITKMDIEDKEYVVVVPKDSDEESTDEAIVLRIDKDEEGNEILVTVEDDDEFAIVSEAYETLFSEDELN